MADIEVIRATAARFTTASGFLVLGMWGTQSLGIRV